MKIEKLKVKVSKFNLEKMRVAQLDNLQMIYGGNSFVFDNGDDPGTVTDKAGNSSIRCIPPPDRILKQ